MYTSYKGIYIDILHSSLKTRRGRDAKQQIKRKLIFFVAGIKINHLLSLVMQRVWPRWNLSLLLLQLSRADHTCGIRVGKPSLSSRRSWEKTSSSSSMSAWGFGENTNESEEKNKEAKKSKSNHLLFCLLCFVSLHKVCGKLNQTK